MDFPLYFQKVICLSLGGSMLEAQIKQCPLTPSPNYRTNFQTKLRLFRQFRNVQENLETFPTIQKLSRNFSDFPDKFRI